MFYSIDDICQTFFIIRWSMCNLQSIRKCANLVRYYYFFTIIRANIFEFYQNSMNSFDKRYKLKHQSINYAMDFPSSTIENWTLNTKDITSSGSFSILDSLVLIDLMRIENFMIREYSHHKCGNKSTLFIQNFPNIVNTLTIHEPTFYFVPTHQWMDIV